MESLAVVSGGMDSIVMLYDYRKQIKGAVSFDYGSKHNEKEIPFAVYHCGKIGVPHTVIRLDFSNFKSHLLKTGGDIPDGHYESEVMKKTVVPFRNGIMLSFAVGMAESLGLDSVLIANHAGDHAIYPDCRSEFIRHFSFAAEFGTYNETKVVSPYCSRTKRDIALIGSEIGVDFTKTWSCYKGGEVHCGTCGTCVERKEALDGFDRTRYL